MATSVVAIRSQGLTIELQDVEDDDGAGDEEGLPGLDAIDPSQDVDSIRAEHSQHSHIYIIQDTWKDKAKANPYTFTEKRTD